MPTYELSLILRTLQRPELSQAVKRCCTSILEKGGLIRGMDNLGLKPLPYKMSMHGARFYEGHYITVKFDSSVEMPSKLLEDLKRDTDVIRRNVFADEYKFVPPCQLGPCDFGEMKNPDHEKRIWWSRVKRRHAKSERRKEERKA